MQSDHRTFFTGGLTYLICLIILLIPPGAEAEEGMWIPMLLDRYRIAEMHEAGLGLTAEEIYSINEDCLKDAVVIFGGGCTGEMISENGLLLTNHHCGEGYIQALSSLENDYLTGGFWAMSREEELPSEGLTVTFLRYMRDVTKEVERGIPGGTDPDERRRLISRNMGDVIREATHGTRLEANVKPFYHGNAYYLFVYERFPDVRLVGAPPKSIGNFGADRDNWIWPRHTGDFTLFRVYAGEDNQPAVYSPSNKPYRPRSHLEISAAGVNGGDFTLILGYPGSTSSYLHSDAVRIMLGTGLPLKIGLRSARLEIMDRYMKASRKVELQYATKYRRVSNSWKKWQGIVLGLNRMDVAAKKSAEENAFLNWVGADDERRFRYEGILEELSALHRQQAPFDIAVDVMDEAVMAVELTRFASRLQQLMMQGRDADRIIRRMERFYRDFHLPVDRDIFAAMMKAGYDHLPPVLHPEFFRTIHGKYRGNYARFAGDTYRKTLIGTREDAIDLAGLYSRNPHKALGKLRKDPVLRYLHQFRDSYTIGVYPEYHRIQEALERGYKTYMAALLEMKGDSVLYPNANFTMRLTYGEVEGYRPADGVWYHHTTYLKGVMEKQKEGDTVYHVPDKLIRLYNEKAFGRYGTGDGMPVCFIASNHTSGGNSGSPVLDADGRLIGLNFDRNWEGTMSDIYYDPSICRNIAVDIRYVLFIIDTFAGAGYLLDEMDIYW